MCGAHVLRARWGPRRLQFTPGLDTTPDVAPAGAGAVSRHGNGFPVLVSSPDPLWSPWGCVFVPGPAACKVGGIGDPESRNGLRNLRRLWESADPAHAHFDVRVSVTCVRAHGHATDETLKLHVSKGRFPTSCPPNACARGRRGRAHPGHRPQTSAPPARPAPDPHGDAQPAKRSGTRWHRIIKSLEVTSQPVPGPRPPRQGRQTLGPNLEAPPWASRVRTWGASGTPLPLLLNVTHRKFLVRSL